MSDIIPGSSQQTTNSALKGGAADGTAVNAAVDNLFENILGPAGDKRCKYEKVRIIGKGSFGEAWLVKNVSTGKFLVAKRMELSKMSEKDKRYVLSEIQCQASCNHFAIIKYIEDFTEGNYMLIVMEFADAGDLNMQIKHRRKCDNQYFEEHEVGYTFVQLAMAVDHIHRRRMLHRDIKGANVMLMTSGLIKLGDFGFSSKYELSVSDQVATTFCGTPYYLAPELWRRQRYSKKADMWALGILLYEMMALERPYAGEGMRTLMKSVLMNERAVPLPDRFSHSLRGVCEALLQDDPNKRPSAAELLQMPHMVKLLSDFETSMHHSPHIDDATKSYIQDNINEIRTTVLSDQEASTYVGPVDSVQNHVYYEGNIRKEGVNEWKERFLVLRDGSLVISRKKGEKEGRPLPVTAISSVVPIPPQTARAEGVFAINMNDEHTMWIQAPSHAISCEWIHKIQQAMGVA